MERLRGAAGPRWAGERPNIGREADAPAGGALHGRATDQEDAMLIVKSLNEPDETRGTSGRGGNGSAETLWFLGTLARMKLVGAQTGGRFALWEAVLPHGAAPPLHSHPQ